MDGELKPCGIIVLGLIPDSDRSIGDGGLAKLPYA
jgi:hypothetical protein